MFDWRLFRTSRDHPDEATLLAGAVSADPTVARHIADCPACAARVEAAETAWKAVREAAAAEADAAFTDVRLARQHAAVMRRLDPSAHPARVLTFPSTVHLVAPGHRVAMRWAAVAAVAGLLLGVSVGRVLDRWPYRAPVPATHVATTVPEAAEQRAAAGGATEMVGEEAFLAAISAAPLTPSIEPLHALDAMTPRTAETSPPR